MEAIINAFVIFLAALLLAVVPLWFLWRMKSAPGNWRLASLAGGHALYCLVLLLFVNSLPGFFSGNADLYARIALVLGPERTVNQPFVLIDNSGNKQLVPDPEGNLEDSTVLVITDRAKLARLLKRLAAQHDDFAQVVVDIAFPTPSPADSLLREAVLDLAVHHKVLLARSAEENTPVLSFGEDVMADVTERTQENLIAWHTIIRDEEYLRGEAYSLPYALYLRLHQRKPAPFTLGLSRERPGWRLVYPGFVPSWAFLPDTDPADEDVSLDDLPMPVGHALDAGWSRLLRRLKAHGDGSKPVVFIGEFPAVSGEASVDRHRTYMGDRAGSALLIDLFHEIDRGAHVVKGWTLVILYLALCACSAYVFRRAWPAAGGSKRGYSAILFKHVVDAVKAILPPTLLVGVAILLRYFTDQQMNLPPLLLYFITLMALVGALRRERAAAAEAAAKARAAEGK